jgi:nitrite reductase (NADH) small subunit
MNSINKYDPTDSTWKTVCELEDLVEGVGECALLEGKQIALFRLSGSKEIFALDNFDPFSNANVISRGLTGDIDGQLVVASPVYKQHFNLQTGQCLEDTSVCLTTYTVRIDNNSVQVSLK